MAMTEKEMNDFMKLQEIAVSSVIRLTALELLLKDKMILDEETYIAKVKQVGEEMNEKIKKMADNQASGIKTSVKEENNTITNKE